MELSKFIKFKELIFTHPENIDLKFVTLDVSNLDKSSDIKDEQSLNNSTIFSTWLVLKLDKSKYLRDEQPLNILPISNTFLVSNFDKGKFVIEEQPWNIEFMFDTDDVLKLFDIFKQVKE